MKRPRRTLTIAHNGRETRKKAPNRWCNLADSGGERSPPTRNGGGGQRPQRDRVQDPLGEGVNQEAESRKEIMTEDRFSDGGKNERDQEELTAEAQLPGNRPPGPNGFTIGSL